VAQYQVERCQGINCQDFAFLSYSPSLTYSDTGLAEAVTYQYRVLALDTSNNPGGYSPIGSATTFDVTPPATPTITAALGASPTEIDLTWTMPTPADNVGVTGYRVERCAGATCTNFVEVGTPIAMSFADSGRTASTTYRYQVRAVDAAGNLGGYSGIANGTTPAAPDVTAPSVPTLQSVATISGSQINLSWAASTDNVGVTGYLIERCQGSGCSSFASITDANGVPGTSYSDVGLADGFTYRYRVRARDAANNKSGYSSVLDGSTPDVTNPTAPGVPSFSSITSNSAAATWSPASDNVGVSNYYYTLDGTNISVVAGNVTSVTLTNLAVLTGYTLQLWAKDTAGHSSPVVSNSFTTTAVTLACSIHVGTITQASGSFRFDGYHTGWEGVMSPLTIAPGLNFLEFDDIGPQGLVAVTGFTSDPGQAWLVSATALSQTRTGSAAASYYYTSSTGTGNWSVGAFGFINHVNEQVPCQLQHR
jgi:hypothetical protein